MIPTYTYTIKNNIIQDYLGANLVVALINNVALGITDTPTATEAEARRNFNSLDLFNFEIGSGGLNGYARAIIAPPDINPIAVNTSLTEASLSVSFTASGGAFEQITHIVALRGANLSGADPVLNGNNRGDTNGSIIFVEPVDNTTNPGTPLVIADGVTFNYNFSLVSATTTI